MLKFALMFVPQVDVTGIATVVLAAVTISLAVIGKQALGRTDRALRQTQAELKLSRSQVEQAHRPVITPLNDETSAALAGVGSRPLKPNVIAGRLSVPITNIGSGPALDVEVEVRLPNGSYGQTERVAGIGVGQQVPIPILLSGGTVPRFSFEARYRDVGDNTWLTRATFEPNLGSGLMPPIGQYTAITFTPGVPVAGRESGPAG